MRYARELREAQESIKNLEETKRKLQGMQDRTRIGAAACEAAGALSILWFRNPYFAFTGAALATAFLIQGAETRRLEAGCNEALEQLKKLENTFRGL